MSKYTTIQICDDSNVRTIKMNRPERRNALNATMIAELIIALEHAADGPCGALILTGAGKCFCAGLDLEELRQMESRTIEEHLSDAEQFAKLMRLLYDFPKPTIAAVNGPAIAGGTGLATVCDFTYASSDATFGYTEVRIGFVPAIVSSFLLRQLGEKQARDLLLSGRIFDAKEAHQLGLVTRIIVHPQILLREAFNQGLCLLKNSPEAMRWTKGLLGEHVRDSLDLETARAAQWNARAKQNDDFREGIHAFLEKRAPLWPSLHKKTSKYQPV
ncbi:Enoyl-CoA hydratase [Acidisarcina polymorpha]|uniref:Enoyl-CoA hydratase n=1 Tax=Acidisarcina polymorpha TaxID=2211140 RepID=A0A2Z5FTQ8_9BACT|nr:enoyl-CoA hydratase-related protein [Acidisarcina polymorpha]AXC09825.1 Enoyl-CoA hydratase [Acidisarcina polymorpha]